MTDLLKTPNIGTGALEDRDRVHFTELRQARLERLLDAMDRDGLDVCLFGREANARYATGVRRLWTAQTRAFVPACVVVRETGRAKLMSFSASYEGIPEEFGSDEFFAVTWNPMRFLEHVVSTPGVASAARVGVDGMMPMFQALLAAALPHATFVGVESMMRSLRRPKRPDEIAAIRIAAALAESALADATRAVRPGVSENELQGVFLARMCELGTTQFSRQGTFTVIDPGEPVRAMTGDRVLANGCLVALAGGALWNGYEGALGRTWWCGTMEPTDDHRALYRRWREAMHEMIDACRAGSSGADIRAAHERAGESLPTASVAYAIGLGHEGPIANCGAAGLDAQQRLDAGMVLGVRTTITSDAGAYTGEEMVLVTDDEPELLTTLSHGPLAG
jgi:Xaa-Pro aminopeptidase